MKLVPNHRNKCYVFISVKKYKMDTTKPGLSFNSSEEPSYSKEDVFTTKTKNDVKQVLKSRIFLGRYIERRLVNTQIGYRDLVVISPAEVELKRDLMESQQNLRSLYPNGHWIGITEADNNNSPIGTCLWTEIDNQPFGPFWFQIKTLKFREKEIILILKCIRHITDAYLEVEPMLIGTSTKKAKEVSRDKTDTVPVTENENIQEIISNLKNAFSVGNAKEFVTFLFAFIIAIFTGSTTLINFLGNFILALLREMSILIKNTTPMFLGLLDFFSKIVGGFYILLAMFFKPNSPVPTSKRTLTYNQRNRQNDYYDNRQFD